MTPPCKPTRRRPKGRPAFKDLAAQYAAHLAEHGTDPAAVTARLARLRAELRYLALVRAGRIYPHRLRLWATAQEPPRRGRPDAAAAGPGAGREVRAFAAWAEGAEVLPPEPRGPGARYWFYPKEFLTFVGTVLECGETAFGLTAPQRGIVYLAAVMTGLPPRALARLTPADFVTVGTGLRVAGVLIPGAHVSTFKVVLARARPGEPLFPPAGWGGGKQAGAMLAADFRHAPAGVRALEDGQRIGFDAFLRTRRYLIRAGLFRYETRTPGKPSPKDRLNPDNKTPHQVLETRRKLYGLILEGAGVVPKKEREPRKKRQSPDSGPVV